MVRDVLGENCGVDVLINNVGYVSDVLYLKLMRDLYVFFIVFVKKFLVNFWFLNESEDNLEVVF